MGKAKLISGFKIETVATEEQARVYQLLLCTRVRFGGVFVCVLNISIDRANRWPLCVLMCVRDFFKLPLTALTGWLMIRRVVSLLAGKKREHQTFLDYSHWAPPAGEPRGKLDDRIKPPGSKCLQMIS